MAAKKTSGRKYSSAFSNDMKSDPNMGANPNARKSSKMKPVRVTKGK